MPITELDQVLSALATKMDQSRDHLDAKIDDVSENLCKIVNLEFDTLNKRVIHITGKMDDQMGTLNGRVGDITNKIDDGMGTLNRRVTNVSARTLLLLDEFFFSPCLFFLLS